MNYRATFLAILVASLPGTMPAVAGAASSSMDVTNTTKYDVYARAERDGATKFHLHSAPMKSQQIYDTGTYVLEGYAIINGLKVALPPLTLKLSASEPLVLIISESKNVVAWGTRRGTSSGGNWY